MGVGRFVCVALPFILTVGAIIAMMAAGLSGTGANKDLYMFHVNTTNLQVSSDDLISSGVVSRSILAAEMESHVEARVADNIHGSNFNGVVSNKATSSSSNLTAENLGLYSDYRINLWNYCYTAFNGTTGCSSFHYNWAKDVLNITTAGVQPQLNAAGKQIKVPSAVQTGLDAFAKVTYATEIVFTVAYIALFAELLFGIFATCTRVMSCLTWLIAGVALVACCAAAALSTAMSVIVVGTLQGTAKWYGVTSGFNKHFLAAVWIGAALAIASSFFWFFTICCCKPDHTRSRKTRAKHLDSDSEKYVGMGSGAGATYAPVHQGEYHNGYQGAGAHTQQPQQPQSYGYATTTNAPQKQQHSGAYEPYSHANV